MAGTMESIESAKVIAFSERVHIEAQQLTARMKPYLEMGKLEQADYEAIDSLGDIELTELTSRFQDIEWSDIEHSRRKLPSRRFGVAIPVSGDDLNRILLSPESKYAAQVAAAVNRRIDRTALEAAGASVYTGRHMDTLVTAATDGVLTVNMTAGVTYAKILEIGQNFMDNEVGNDNEVPVVWTITGDEHTALMQLLQLTSGDYSREMVVDKGRIQKACGIDLVKYGGNGLNPILSVSNGTRTGFAIAKGGVLLKMGVSEMYIEKRPEKYQTRQLVCVVKMGAVRQEGKLVQKVTSSS